MRSLAWQECGALPPGASRKRPGLNYPDGGNFNQVLCSARTAAGRFRRLSAEPPMIRINEHYTKLNSSYLFTDIARRVAAFQEAHPGRVDHPPRHRRRDRAAPAGVRRGAPRRGRRDGPARDLQGLRPRPRLRFPARGHRASTTTRPAAAPIEPDEIFISDGAKCDCGNIQELFAADARIAIPDPVYPVYLDTNVMAGRTGPERDGRYDGHRLPRLHAGKRLRARRCPRSRSTSSTCASPTTRRARWPPRAQLAAWVDYAKRNRAAHPLRLRLRVVHPRSADSALHLRDRRRARRGHRVPQLLQDRRIHRHPLRLHRRAQAPWSATTPRATPTRFTRSGRGRQATKFNGVSYPVQRAAAAVFTDEGRRQTRALADFYLGNARLIRDALTAAGLPVRGRRERPVPLGQRRPRLLGSSSTCCSTRPASSSRPGAGFGRCGEGHVRISAFNSRENVAAALDASPRC